MKESLLRQFLFLRVCYWVDSTLTEYLIGYVGLVTSPFLIIHTKIVSLWNLPESKITGLVISLIID